MRLLFFLFLALNTISTTSSKEVSISGKVSQLVGYNAYLKEIDYYNVNSIGKVIDSVKINDSTGYFEFKINLNSPVKYALFIGEYNAVTDTYLWPGDSLYFDIKFDELVSYEVYGSGSGFGANKFLTDFVSQFKVTKELQEKYQKAASSDTVDNLVKFITDHRNVQLAYIKNYGNAPQNVKNELSFGIEYDWATTIISRLLDEIKNQYQKSGVVWDYSKYLTLVINDVKVNNPDAWKSFGYRNFIDKYLMLEFFRYYFAKAKEGMELPVLDSYKYLFATARNHFDGIPRDIAFTGLFRDILAEMKSKEDYNYAISELETVKNEITDKNFLNTIQYQFDIQKPLLGGMPVPQFSLPDTTGKMISISDFKGKVVYIDFWGTWCGPCRKEIPFLKELHDKFEKNNKVVFMSIALERGEKDAWLSFVRSQGLKGVQLFVDKNNRKIGELFRIASVPTFMLVDKNGNLVDPNAKRPSDSGIEEDIKKLLD